MCKPYAPKGHMVHIKYFYFCTHILGTRHLRQQHTFKYRCKAHLVVIRHFYQWSLLAFKISSKTPTKIKKCSPEEMQDTQRKMPRCVKQAKSRSTLYTLAQHTAHQCTVHRKQAICQGRVCFQQDMSNCNILWLTKMWLTLKYWTRPFYLWSCSPFSVWT